jgi:hypothetical protein
LTSAEYKGKSSKVVNTNKDPRIPELKEASDTIEFHLTQQTWKSRVKKGLAQDQVRNYRLN